MHLKSLTLKGFKSFAQATTFAFEPGVTCIVGPNGSGKSNVVDALAWVMGEQGAKTLRGGSMADVIFAGTASRGPLGRAEVVLTIDNTDGALPIEYSEVTISRTLFRSGASEYAINGRGVRLLDVQELLSDSGLGREMHVIVGQGQLDQVLRASPEERRGFLEEAAGILKHRRRKERTLRKLESMQANLTRLTDLADELRRQLKPLGAQAEVAREAVAIQATVRDARTRLLAADAVRLAAAVAATESARRDLELEREVAADRERALAADAGALERDAAGEELDEARRAALELEAVQQRLRALAQLAATRVALLGPDEALAAVPSEAALRARHDELERLEPAVAAAEAALAAATAEQAQAQHRLDEIDTGLAGDAARIGEVDRFIGAAAGRVAEAEAALDARVAEADRLAEAAAAGAVRVEEACAAVPAPPAASDATGDDRPDPQQAEAEAAAALERDRTALHDAERELAGLDASIAALRRAEPAADATAALLSAGRAGLGPRVRDVLRVDGGWTAAIAAVLGPLADAALAESGEVALDAADAAQGAAALVVAAPHRRPDPVPAVPGTTPAREVVDGPDGVLDLLAPVLLVDDLPAARAALPGLADPRTVLVTRAGVVVGPAALVMPGDGRSGLELLAEREAAERRRTAVTSDVGTLRGRLEADRAALREARERAASAAAEARRRENEAREADRRRAGALARLEAAEAEVERLAARAEQARAAVEPARAVLADAEAALAAARAEPRPVLDASRRSEALAAVDAARERGLAALLELQRLQDRRAAERRRIAEAERAAVAAQRARAAAEARNERRRRERASAEGVLAELPAVQRSVDASVTEAHMLLADATRERDRRSGALRAARDELLRSHSHLAELEARARDLDMRGYEQQVSLGALLERARTELGLDERALLQEADPALDRTAEERRLRQAERRLAQLGRVNPLALEEFAALEQRHAFLTEQLADLTRTRQDLLRIVAELDARMATVFDAAYRDTEEAFTRILPVLFPGGTGRLALVGDDLDTSGVEVSVRPAGKRIERLSLLSGGERSLAAIAYLLAIFTARPSPFYILDEVEAALDDANLGRLLEVLSALRTSSQLIVITHQKRTMEIADALYGVSMRQDGVSAVIGQRLTASA